MQTIMVYYFMHAYSYIIHPLPPQKKKTFNCLLHFLQFNESNDPLTKLVQRS